MSKRYSYMIIQESDVYRDQGEVVDVGWHTYASYDKCRESLLKAMHGRVTEKYIQSNPSMGDRPTLFTLRIYEADVYCGGWVTKEKWIALLMPGVQSEIKQCFTMFPEDEDDQ